MSRAARIVRVALIAAGALWAIYVAAMAGLVTSGLAAKMINSAQDDVDISHGFAWSWFPGRLRVRELAIRGHDSHADWTLDVDDARAWISPLPLSSKTLRLGGAHARGVEFSIAMKERPRDAPPPDVSKLWTLDLTSVHGEDVRDVTVEGFRFRGSAELRGGFFMFPTQRIRLEPTRAEISIGTLSHPGGGELARNIRASADGRIEDIYLPELEGLRIFRALTARGELSAKISSPRFANRFLARSKWIRFQRGSGELKAAVDIERGRVQPGTELSFASSHLEARLASDVASGAGRATFTVDAKKSARLRLVLKEFESKKASAERPYVRGQNLRADISTRDLDLVAPFRNLDLVLRVPEAIFTDLRAFNDRFPRELAFTAGTATVSMALHITPQDRLEDGELYLTARNAGVRVKGKTFHGDADLDVKFSAADLSNPALRLDSTSLKIRESSGWQARARLGRTMLIPRENIPDVDAEIEAQLTDVRPIFILFDAQVPGWAKELLAMPDAKARVHLMAIDQVVGLRDLDLRSGNLQLRARAILDQPPRGVLLLTWASLAFGAELGPGGTKINILNPTANYQQLARGIAAQLDRRRGRVKQVGPPEPLVEISKPE